jgi:anti-sigma B factor antagonist
MTGYDTRKIGETVVVQPAGRLNMVAAPRLREQLRELVNSGTRRLVVTCGSPPPPSRSVAFSP